MKYIIIDYSIPVVFSEANNHKDFKNIGNITSAAFFNISAKQEINDEAAPRIRVHCYGESQSLGLKKDICDERILERLFNSY